MFPWYWFFTVGLAVAVVSLGWMVRRQEQRNRSLRVKLQETQKQRKEATDFLGLFTTSLATTNDCERAMDIVAHYICDLLEADSLCIYQLIEENGERRLQGSTVVGMFPPLRPVTNINLVTSKASHLKEHLRHERFAFGEGLVGRTAAEQRSLLVEDARLAPLGLELGRDIRTAMAVPMFSENQVEGVIVVANAKDPQRHFNYTDLKSFEHLAHQAAMANVLTTIYGERTRQERIVQELEFARQIQMSLLPESIPIFGDYLIQADNRSALEVGGDFYDFIIVDEDRMIVLVADASGKGVPACMLMAMCQSFARAEAEHFTMMEEYLTKLNRQLYRETDQSRFVTVAALMIDKRNNVCEYARAGHTELLLRLESGKCRIIKPKGAAIGLLPEDFVGGFDTISFSFTPGTSLMIFTDGINEALNENGEEFGLDRLFHIWERGDLHPENAADAVFAAVGQFVGDTPQTDDQTLLVISRAPVVIPQSTPAAQPT